MVKALGREWNDDAGNGRLSSAGDNGSLTVGDGGAAQLAQDLGNGRYSLTFELDGNDLPGDAKLTIGFGANALRATGGKFTLGPSATEVELPKAYVKRTVVFDVKKDTIRIELQGAAGNTLASAESPRVNKVSSFLDVSLMQAGGKILVVPAFSYEGANQPGPPPVQPPMPQPGPRPNKPPKPVEQASYKGFSSSALAWAQDQERLLWDL